jgi:hypothetical protein
VRAWFNRGLGHPALQRGWKFVIFGSHRYTQNWLSQ